MTATMGMQDMGHPPWGQRTDVTCHGDAGGVLVLLGDDTHQSRGQQQEDEGVFELRKEEKICN